MLSSLTLLPLLIPTVSTPPPAVALSPRLERIVVAETPVVLELWRESRGTEHEATWYRIALDGEHWSRPRPARSDIDLRWGRFDPLVAPPELAEAPLPAAGELFIVQLVTQSLEAYREALHELGAEVSRALPHHAHLVRMDAATREKVEALPWVRWVGLYHPIYRLDPEIAVELGEGKLGHARYRIQVLERGPAQKAVVAGRLLDSGATIDAQIPDGFILEATLDEEQLSQVVTYDEVLYVDRWSAPEDDMNLIRIDGGANWLETNYGFTGQGVRGECCDGNVNEAHPDLQSNPVIFHGSHGGDTSHGTPVTGVVFGDGATSANARGLLPDGQPIFADNGYLGNRYTHTAQLLQSPYFCVFQTCSWGSTRTTAYNSYSFEMDDILFLNDVVITQSQSNAGNQDSRPQAWAKNVVAVGAVRHQNTIGTGDDSWSGSASIGPAADGRIKPDLHYWYDSIYTLDSTGHSNFCCTSAATPCVAGYFGLLFQMWHEGVFPGRGGAATVFESRPRATTARALMINGAWSYPFSGANHDLTRTHQGWGRPDVERLVEWADRTFIVDEEQVLGNLEVVSYPLTVLAGETELRATMVYLDPAGTTSAAQHRINDLSLKVTSPGSQVYWGNNGLRTGNLSTTGGSSNTKDVVENVFVANPAPGTWVVEVFADSIVEDAHTETGAVDADFALVVSGVLNDPCAGPQTYCQTAPNSVGPGAQITWLGFPGLSANDFYLAATDCPAGQFLMFYYGAGQTQTPFGNGWRCVNAGGTGVFRFSPFLVDIVGNAVMRVDFTQPPVSSGSGMWQLGDTWYCQAWYRDPAGGGAQFNLSDGLQLEICP